MLSLQERPKGQPQAEAERWAIRDTPAPADIGAAVSGFALRWPDEMRLGCEPLLNGMQAILARAQAPDWENRPREAASIRFGGGKLKPLSGECLSGEFPPKHTCP